MTQQIYIGTIHWHLFTCNNVSPNSNKRPSFWEEDSMRASSPYNKDSVSRHEVCTSCCVQMAFEVLDFALTVERTDTESCISYFVSSTPLPWDQAGQKRLQLREKGRPFDKVFWLLGTWQCSGGWAWLYRNCGQFEVLTGAHGGQLLGYAKLWEECSFPRQLWRAVKGPSLSSFCIETDMRACRCLVRGGLLGLLVVEEEERRS